MHHVNEGEKSNSFISILFFSQSLGALPLGLPLITSLLWFGLPYSYTSANAEFEFGFFRLFVSLVLFLGCDKSTPSEADL